MYSNKQILQVQIANNHKFFKINKYRPQSEMINFASLFNQSRFNSNNAVSQLLQQDDVTLPKLLDQESFINEYKSGNTKLIEFLKYDKVKQLVDYITIVGPADDKKRGYKFPLSASDVLSCDNSIVLEYFLPEDKLYDEKVTTVEQQVWVDAEDGQDEDGQSQQKKQDNSPVQVQKQKTIIKDSMEESQQSSSPRQPPNSPEQLSTQANQQQFPQFQQLPSKQSNGTPKTKVKKLSKVQKIQKVEVQPLINLLFKYFDQEVNYVLTGYVSKVLNALLMRKGNQLMEFLFQDNRVDKMVNHIQSRSVGEFLIKVLTFESNKLARQRAQFFKRLLLKLAENNAVHVLSNFSSFVSQTIQKASLNAKGTSPVPQFTTIFFTPEIITIVIKNVMSDFQNVSVYNAPILLTYLTNVPFTLPQDQNIIQQFKNLLKLFIEKSLQKLNVTNETRPKLGFGRIKIIEILSYILKENLLGSRDIFAQQPNAFSTLFNLCKNYEMNNVLHNLVVRIISIAFSDEKLSLNLLQNDVLLNFILVQAQEDVEIRNGKGSQSFRKGYIGHIVQIARLIQEYAKKKNQVAQKIQQRDQFAKILNILVDRQVFQSNKSLAGFSLRKQIKHEIMFQKQDIINHYIDFLTHSPKPVFQAEPQLINIQHPDLLEQLQRQIEENISTEQSAKPLNQEVDQLDIIRLQEQLRIQVHFFKGHLDYDLDELMQDL